MENMANLKKIRKVALQIAKQITEADSYQMSLSKIRQSLDSECYFGVVDLLRKSGVATFVDYTGGDSSVVLSPNDYDKFERFVNGWYKDKRSSRFDKTLDRTLKTITTIRQFIP